MHMKFLIRFLGGIHRDDAGATVVEYALFATFVAVTLFVGIKIHDSPRPPVGASSAPVNEARQLQVQDVGAGWRLLR